VRNWGIVITLFYALVLLCLLLPGGLLLTGQSVSELLRSYGESFTQSLTWVWIAILVGSQILLLFLSVDTSRKKLKPRQHVLVSVLTAALLFALLAYAAMWAFVGGFTGDNIFKEPHWSLIDSQLKILGWLLALWLLWGLIFYLYARGTPERAARIIGWLLKGSVLELLIAVPAHVVVRQRGDCSAPLLTGFGIVTGVAIMLLSFGPSILFLYKKRLERYNRPVNHLD
jgi:uncharacterized membrane protein